MKVSWDKIRIRTYVIRYVYFIPAHDIPSECKLIVVIKICG